MASVSDYMTEVVVVQKSETVIEVIKTMVANQKRIVAVVGATNRIEGVVTYTDILKLLEADIKHSRIMSGTVEIIMKGYARFAFTEPTASLLEALRMMVDEGVRNLVVVRGLHPVGMINQEEILRWWLNEIVENK
jgi:CBS domain-containing protein